MVQFEQRLNGFERLVDRIEFDCRSIASRLFGVCVLHLAAVIEAYHRAIALGSAPIEKPPRTIRKGTPLHELWIKDPDGNLIEIYARLTEAEQTQKPTDEAPVFLVRGTG